MPGGHNGRWPRLGPLLRCRRDGGRWPSGTRPARSAGTPPCARRGDGRARQARGGLQEQAGEEDLGSLKVRGVAEQVQGELLAVLAAARPGDGHATEVGPDRREQVTLVRGVGRIEPDHPVTDRVQAGVGGRQQGPIDAVVRDQLGRLRGVGLRFVLGRRRILGEGQQFANLRQDRVWSRSRWSRSWCLPGAQIGHADRSHGQCGGWTRVLSTGHLGWSSSPEHATAPRIGDQRGVGRSGLSVGWRPADRG